MSFPCVPSGRRTYPNFSAIRFSRVGEVMLATIKGDERILDTPAPIVIVTGLGDSSVNLELRFWTENPLDKYALQWEYSERCKRALDKAEIQIPFPHMQIFIERSDGLADLLQTRLKN